ncbi:MAG: hypothetical protein KatS3mg077_0543 [Candidatus Binatia bacterium]|nr:MAG: hypothetical protein KatS3mg077_0543 [Candidatus Binatia bacterium]
MFVDYYYRHVDPRGMDAINGHGAVAQTGYFILLARKLEVAARYAWMDPNDSVANDSVQEYGSAVGYFVRDHNLEVQADLRRIDTERPGEGAANDFASARAPTA